MLQGHEGGRRETRLETMTISKVAHTNGVEVEVMRRLRILTYSEGTANRIS